MRQARKEMRSVAVPINLIAAGLAVVLLVVIEDAGGLYLFVSCAAVGVGLTLFVGVEAFLSELLSPSDPPMRR